MNGRTLASCGLIAALFGALACSADDAAAPFDFCRAGVTPDAACYAERRDPGSVEVALALAIAEKQIEEHPARSLGWNWGPSVLAVGMDELYRVTGNESVRNYYRAWIDHHIEGGYTIATSDTLAPAQTALALYRESGDAAYREVVERGLEYLYDEAPRTEAGGINHLGTVTVFGTSIWVDSLFMFGNLLTRWGELAGDRRALDEFADQHAIFTAQLQKASGFYRHADRWVRPQDDDVFWGRGNGWVMAATFEHLRVLLLRGEENRDMEAAALRQFEAIFTTQDPETGLWWTVVNRPGETYLETSATALFAWGLARGWRYGLLGDEVLPTIAHAMAGVRSRIVTDDAGRPVVTGISGPTDVGDFAYYADVPTGDDIDYGLGAVIMALVETSGLPLD